LLLALGYQPPPPVQVYGAEFAEAMQRAVEGHDIRSTRKRVRRLGKILVALSGAGNVDKGKIRRWLRRGARVAGSLIVVATTAATGTAVAAYIKLHGGDEAWAAAGPRRSSKRSW
jgi:hypothetical protein